MSGLAAMFGKATSLDDANFRYDANRYKQQQQQQEVSQFPYRGQIQLFRFNNETNKSDAYGAFILCIRPVPPAYQLLIYQNQAQPLINLQITKNLKWVIRDNVYCYLTDPSGTMWTIQFADFENAARCTITLGSILDSVKPSQMAFYDGLQGNGQFVETGDTVSVKYIGFLADKLPMTGKKFDANDNYSFVVGSEKTIRGWSLGVIGMNVGGTRALYIPPEYAYGASGVGGVIPPNASLSFLVTITSSKSRNPTPQEQPVQQPVQQQQPQEQTPKQTQPVQQQQSPQSGFADRMKRMGAVQMMPMSKGLQPSDQSSSDFSTDASRRMESESDSKQVYSPVTTQPMAQEQPVQQAQPQQQIIKVVQDSTVDESQVLARMDQLNELLNTKFESLMATANEEMPSAVLCDEIQQLAADLDRKERQIKDQQHLIEELKTTKSGARLKVELDNTQKELEQLRDVLRGGRDLRRENEDLRAELRRLREENLAQLETNVGELREELSNSRQTSAAAAATRAKELFFGFMGSAVEELKKRFEGQDSIKAQEVTAIVSDVFQKCQERTFRQIDEDGLL